MVCGPGMLGPKCCSFPPAIRRMRQNQVPKVGSRRVVASAGPEGGPRVSLVRIVAWWTVPVVCAAFLLVLLVTGCGTTTVPDITAAMIRDDYGDLLADRYDEVFPDDRVPTVRIIMDEADWEDMQATMLAKEYYRANISIDGELVEGVAVRTKGNSSLKRAASSASFRAGLKVDFNFFNSELTYHGLKKLCYSNGFSDPTLVREFLGYEIMAATGIPTPRACFVDLWVNETHLGVYTQVEAVDGRFVDDRFADGNGNLYKPEVVAGKLDWTEADATVRSSGTQASRAERNSSSGSSTESFNIGGGDLEDIIERLGDEVGWIPGRLTTDESATSTSAAAADTRGARIAPGGAMAPGGNYLAAAGLKTNEDKADYSRLYDLLSVINADPEQVSTDDLEKILDVDALLRFLAASTVLVHLDNYTGTGHNYYLYDDGGRFSIIPWDLNMCFGGFDAGLDERRLIDFLIDEPTSASVAEYPLVEQLIDEPEYMDLYHLYLEALIEGPFSVERMTTRINQIADLLRPFVANDEDVPLGRFERGLIENLPHDRGSWNSAGTFIGLEYFVRGRVASVAAQLSGEQESSFGDGSGNRGLSRPGGIPGVGGAGPGVGGDPRQAVPGGAQALGITGRSTTTTTSAPTRGPAKGE